MITIKFLEAGGKARRRKKLTKWSKEQVLEAVRKAEIPNLLTTYRDRLALYSAARRGIRKLETKHWRPLVIG